MPADHELAKSTDPDPFEEIRELRREVASLKRDVTRQRRWFERRFTIGFWLMAGYLLTLSAVNAVLGLKLFEMTNRMLGF